MILFEDYTIRLLNFVSFLTIQVVIIWLLSLELLLEMHDGHQIAITKLGFIVAYCNSSLVECI